jgi:ribosome-associated heat shock protein Hsp15
MRQDPQRSDRADADTAAAGALRIDRWLWCARFFRTRSLAQRAVEGGHVQVNGERVRSSRLVRVGDRLRIVRDRERYDVAVTGIPARRGPATEARLCYIESEESAAARAHARELSRLSAAGPASRPDKRERRELIRTVKRGG